MIHTQPIMYSNIDSCFSCLSKNCKINDPPNSNLVTLESKQKQNNCNKSTRCAICLGYGIETIEKIIEE